MSPPRALVLLASGAEEMEVSIVVDVLRRAGIEVTLAGLDSADPVVCSRQVVIVPDVALNQVQGAFDALVLPGGAKGAQRLSESPRVGALLRECEQQGRLVAAICAAPSALKAHRVFAGKRMTIYPTLEAEIADYGQLQRARIVQDGNLLTSQGPGTAFEFALEIVTNLMGKEKSAQVKSGILLS